MTAQTQETTGTETGIQAQAATKAKTRGKTVGKTKTSTANGVDHSSAQELKAAEEAATDTSRIIRIPASLLEIVHEDNARRYSNLDVKDMEEELMSAGHQLQPVGVRPKGENGLYRLVWGFRRAMALTNIQNDGVPDNHPLAMVNAVIFQGTDKDYYTANMEENIHRKNLTPIETADWAKRMVDEFGVKKKDIAVQLRMTPGNLSQIMALLTLPPNVQKLIGSGKLAVSTGYDLSQLEGDAQAKAVQEALDALDTKGRATRADVRRANRDTAEAGEEETKSKTPKKDRTYKELKVHLEGLMDKIRKEDGGSDEEGWEPPKGYQVLEAILDFSNGKRGSQKRLWDLVSEL